ncbi:MAG: hypothetical protein K0U30_00175 [Actinomycetia bacterium]|nr:hypothetical protein [Actinomycetes bacterium]
MCRTAAGIGDFHALFVALRSHFVPDGKPLALMPGSKSLFWDQSAVLVMSNRALAL